MERHRPTRSSVSSELAAATPNDLETPSISARTVQDENVPVPEIATGQLEPAKPALRRFTRTKKMVQRV